MDKRRFLYNNLNSAYSFGSWISFISVSMSCVLIKCEIKFHTISSIKISQRAVVSDLGFSGLNTNKN